MDPKLVTLATLGDGAAEELFQTTLRQVLDNIDDPNTEAEALRAITLNVRIMPQGDRRGATVLLSCTAKLPGIRPTTTNVLLGRHKGQLAAACPPRQEDMFSEPAATPMLVTTEGGQ